MHRIAVVVLAVLIGAAAPARAWCEATCLAPVQAETSTKSHCPAHESPSTGTSISATEIGDCPVVDAARPPSAARLELKAAATTFHAPQFAPSLTATAVSSIVPQTSTVFTRHTPLRI